MVLGQLDPAFGVSWGLVLFCIMVHHRFSGCAVLIIIIWCLILLKSFVLRFRFCLLLFSVQSVPLRPGPTSPCSLYCHVCDVLVSSLCLRDCTHVSYFLFYSDSLCAVSECLLLLPSLCLPPVPRFPLCSPSDRLHCCISPVCHSLRVAGFRLVFPV